MQVTLINGSPRGLTSNTLLLLEEFSKGYMSASIDEPTIVSLRKLKSGEEQKSVFENAEVLIVGFPLYTDAVPGIIKEFIENLSDFVYKDNNPKLGFIVQSGFPEAHHSTYVEKYLELVARKLKTEYLGTAIRGGIEGIRIQPKWMTKKTFSLFFELGKRFAKNHRFDPKTITAMRTPLKLTPGQRSMYGLLRHFGLTNFYWDSQLKKNKAFDKRFDKPYYS